MTAVKDQFNIKLFLFVLAMISIIMIFVVNRFMIGQLRSEARQQVEYLANSYSDAINSEEEKVLLKINRQKGDKKDKKDNVKDW